MPRRLLEICLLIISRVRLVVWQKLLVGKLLKSFYLVGFANILHTICEGQFIRSYEIVKSKALRELIVQMETGGILSKCALPKQKS